MLNIIVNGYNSSNFLKKCLISIKKQTYKNYKCVIVNDASTETEFEIYAKEYPDFKYIKNKKNVGPLASRIIGIDSLNCKDDDIIFLIDGDDWLLHNNVFQFIVDIYKEDILLTWGNWTAIDTSGKRTSRASGLDGVFIPRMKFIDNNRDILLKKNAYREVPFSFSHPRTFKYILWKNINPDDFLDENGVIFTHATDFAFMYPMLEMAGNKFKIIYEKLYAYNIHDSNEMEKSSNDLSKNRRMGRYILKKKKYLPLIK